MSAPRIALVGDYPPPHGGVAVHVAALARALRAAGLDVRVLDIGRGDHRAEGVVPARGALRFAAALATAAAERRLVHVHTSGANPRSWTVAAAAARARLPGSPPAVLTLHSGHCPAYLARAPAARRAARGTCAAFGQVLAVSGPIAEALHGCGVPAHRVKVLPAFVAAALVPGPPPRGFAALRAARAPVFVAALAPGPTYGEDLLLPAFVALRARHPRAALAIFGPGTEGGALAAAGLGMGVLALGELDHSGALAVIAGADVFVRPTRADGDALSVREALALGRRVVASAVGHRPAGCLLFPAGDAGGLAARLAEAAALPAPPPTGRIAPVRDPFRDLLALYRALAHPASLPRDSAAPAEGPPSWP